MIAPDFVILQVTDVTIIIFHTRAISTCPIQNIIVSVRLDLTDILYYCIGAILIKQSYRPTDLVQYWPTLYQVGVMLIDLSKLQV